MTQTSSKRLLSSVVCFTLVCSQCCFADGYAGKQWPKNQLMPIEQIDHSLFGQLLQKHVDADGQVDYRSWHQSKQDRQALREYLELLSRAAPARTASKNARLAFWINAYNALTIEGILREYPTSSIRNHTAKLFGYNIWKDLYLYVGSDQFSLDHIEHQILRKLDEPRIHFAIVCASKGCPRLLSEAYTAEQVERQLETNAVDFFSRSQNLQIDRNRNVLKLSAILNWFGDDFGENKSQQVRSIVRYVPDSAKKFVAKRKFSVDYLDYDWSLNEQTPKRENAADKQQ